MLIDRIKAFESYLTAEEGLSPSTARQYRLDVLSLAHWLELKRPDVQDWQAVATRELRGYMHDHPLAPARFRRVVSSWKKFWTYLVEVEHLPMQRGPAELKTPKLPTRLPKYLTTDEVTQLLTAAKKQEHEGKALRDWAVLAFLYGSGCRVSEALSLTFDDVEYDADNLPVSVRVVGKGNKQRQVILSPTAQRALTQWLKVRRTRGDPVSPYAFSHLSGQNAGKPFPVRTVQEAMHRAGARAGLRPERCSPHKLRHSHATALLNAGRGLDEIQEVLGHASIATTRIYSHVSKRRLAATAASLPDVLD